MPTFKAEVRQDRQRSDGTFNVRIRVIHNRKPSYIPTQWYITKADLKRDGELKSPYYKDLSDDKIREYRRICDNIPNIATMSVHEIVEVLKDKDKQAGVTANITESMSLGTIIDTLSKKPKNEFRLDIIAYLIDEYELLKKQGKKQSAAVRKTVANSLKRFCKKNELDVNELTTEFVEAYITYLKGDNAKLTRKGVAYPGVISKALDDIKYLHNDEEKGIFNIKVNPFAKIKQNQKRIPSKQRIEKAKPKMTLTVEQIQKIIDLKTFDSTLEELGRDMFLLSFLLVGINSADLYHCTELSDDILTYNRLKVKDRRDDDGEMQVRIEPAALPFFEKYKNKNKFKKEVFCFCNMYADGSNFNKAVNKGLKIIAEKIGVEKTEFSYYSARRSWSTIARNIAKIDKYTVHEALNHVDRDMKITDGYIDKDFSHIWRANSKVIKFFKW
ncbi:MAG: site-specific integrase [Bacteroidales bacterium]|nr:site-specific integrase [Bacteroidales bacterium]